MSEGERNALGLSFFFTQLEKNKVKDSLIIFDDPVTSFDIRRERNTLDRIKKLNNSNTIIILTHLHSFVSNLIQDLDQNSTIYTINDNGIKLCENYIPRNENLKTLLFKHKHLDDDLEAKMINTRKIIEEILICTLLIHENEKENLKKYLWNSHSFTRKMNDSKQKEKFSISSRIAKHEFDTLSKFLHVRNEPYGEEQKESDLKAAWQILERLFLGTAAPIVGAISQ